MNSFNFSFCLFLFHFSPPCTTSKKAKANKKVQVCWNFTHSFGELLLNFFKEHFNCNEFHQTFEDQFIGDQNSEYATEMSIFIVFGKIFILCIQKSFWCVFKIGLRERKFDPRNKIDASNLEKGKVRTRSLYFHKYITFINIYRTLADIRSLCFHKWKFRFDI